MRDEEVGDVKGAVVYMNGPDPLLWTESKLDDTLLI
jgi:hypothetical protein